MALLQVIWIWKTDVYLVASWSGGGGVYRLYASIQRGKDRCYFT